MLAGPHARVLKKLHKYRNEAYHRDQLRLGTLMSAIKIYVYLVCSLMQDFPMHGTGGFIHLPPRPPAGLVKYLEDSETWVPMTLTRLQRGASVQDRDAAAGRGGHQPAVRDGRDALSAPLQRPGCGQGGR